MIAKIMKGSDFKGVIYYILNDEKGTQILTACFWKITTR